MTKITEDNVYFIWISALLIVCFIWIGFLQHKVDVLEKQNIGIVEVLKQHSYLHKHGAVIDSLHTNNIEELISLNDRQIDLLTRLYNRGN